jgi:tetratricopeptide (TPR) repeat protein
LRVYRPKADALKWYQTGVAAIRDGTYYKASKTLEKAVALDSKYPLSHARLAEAYNELDDTDRAQREMLAAEGSSARVSNRDSLNTRAIYAIVTADFQEGANDYRQMLAGAADTDKPAMYVDLGRALEKASSLKDAMDAYREATKLDPSYPAAFLRLAVLAGRGQDRAAAGPAFDKAQSLYDTLGNVEGVTEVIYQRAVQAGQAGRIDDAAALAESAWKKAEAAGNYHQEIGATLQMCEVDIRRNDTDAAERDVG